MKNEAKNQSELILYQTEDGHTRIDVTFQGDTVWLSQQQMADLFDKGHSTIAEHIQNAFSEGELDEKLVCRNFRHTTPLMKWHAKVCLNKNRTQQ